MTEGTPQSETAPADPAPDPAPDPSAVPAVDLAADQAPDQTPDKAPNLPAPPAPAFAGSAAGPGLAPWDEPVPLRGWRGPLLLLFLATLAVFCAYRPGRGASSEPAPFTAPMRQAADRLRQGDVPLWDPSAGLGEPFTGGGRPGVFYPGVYLHLPLPAALAWPLSAALHLWLAGAGVWLLARRAGLEGAPRLLSAAAYMLGGFALARMNAPSSFALAWLPWALLAIDRLIDRPALGRVGAAALVLAVQFLAGDAAASLAFLVMCGLFVLAQLAAARPAATLRALPALTAALLVGGALAGAQWLPAVEAAQDSAAAQGGQGVGAGLRGAAEAVFPYAGAFWPPAHSADGGTAAGWVGTVPLFLALVGLRRGWRGRETRAYLLTAVAALPFALRLPGFYSILRSIGGAVGVDADLLFLPAALAVALLAGLGLRAVLDTVRRRPAWGIDVEAGADVVADAGAGADAELLPPSSAEQEPREPDSTPAPPGTLDLPPLRRRLRIAALACVVLAALAALVLLAAGGPIARAAEASARQDGAAPADAPALAGAFRHSALAAAGRLLLPAALLGLASAVLGWRDRQPHSLLARSHWPWLVLTAADLLAFGAYAGRAAPVEPAPAGAADALRFLQARRDEPGAAPFRVLAADGALPACAVRAAGLDDLRPLGPPSARWADWLRATGGGAEPAPAAPTFLDLPPAALRLLNLRYFVTTEGAPAPPAGWSRVFPPPIAAAAEGAPAGGAVGSREAAPAPPGGGAVVYENRAAGPRAWFASRALWLDAPADAAARVKGDGFDPGDVVLIDRQVPELAAQWAKEARYFPSTGRRAAQPPKVEFVPGSPDELHLRITGGTGGWLVLSARWAEGWAARIDTKIHGREPIPKIVLPAFGLLQAIPLPESGGGQAVELYVEYKPTAFKHGLFLSAAGAALLLLLFGSLLLRPRDRAAREPAGSAAAYVEDVAPAPSSPLAPLSPGVT